MGEIVLNETEQNLAVSNGMSFEARKNALNAITNFESIWDILKSQNELCVNVKNVLVVPITQVDSRTGETRETKRCIFIDEAGKSFATSSESVVNNVNVMLTVLGDPLAWPSAVKCVFTKAESKAGNPFINISF